MRRRIRCKGAGSDANGAGPDANGAGSDASGAGSDGQAARADSRAPRGLRAFCFLGPFIGEGSESYWEDTVTSSTVAGGFLSGAAASSEPSLPAGTARRGCASGSGPSSASLARTKNQLRTRQSRKGAETMEKKRSCGRAAQQDFSHGKAS